MDAWGLFDEAFESSANSTIAKLPEPWGQPLRKEIVLQGLPLTDDTLPKFTAIPATEETYFGQSKDDAFALLEAENFLDHLAPAQAALAIQQGINTAQTSPAGNDPFEQLEAQHFATEIKIAPEIEPRIEQSLEHAFEQLEAHHFATEIKIAPAKEPSIEQSPKYDIEQSSEHTFEQSLKPSISSATPSTIKSAVAQVARPRWELFKEPQRAPFLRLQMHLEAEDPTRWGLFPFTPSNPLQNQDRQQKITDDAPFGRDDWRYHDQHQGKAWGIFAARCPLPFQRGALSDQELAQIADNAACFGLFPRAKITVFLALDTPFNRAHLPPAMSGEKLRWDVFESAMKLPFQRLYYSADESFARSKIFAKTITKTIPDRQPLSFYDQDYLPSATLHSTHHLKDSGSSWYHTEDRESWLSEIESLMARLQNEMNSVAISPQIKHTFHELKSHLQKGYTSGLASVAKVKEATPSRTWLIFQSVAGTLGAVPLENLARIIDLSAQTNTMDTKGAWIAIGGEIIPLLHWEEEIAPQHSIHANRSLMILRWGNTQVGLLMQEVRQILAGNQMLAKQALNHANFPATWMQKAEWGNQVVNQVNLERIHHEYR